MNFLTNSYQNELPQICFNNNQWAGIAQALLNPRSIEVTNFYQNESDHSESQDNTFVDLNEPIKSSLMSKNTEQLRSFKNLSEPILIRRVFSPQKKRLKFRNIRQQGNNSSSLDWNLKVLITKKEKSENNLLKSEFRRKSCDCLNCGRQNQKQINLIAKNSFNGIAMRYKERLAKIIISNLKRQESFFQSNKQNEIQKAQLKKCQSHIYQPFSYFLTQTSNDHLYKQIWRVFINRQIRVWLRVIKLFYFQILRIQLTQEINQAQQIQKIFELEERSKSIFKRQLSIALTPMNQQMKDIKIRGSIDKTTMTPVFMRREQFFSDKSSKLKSSSERNPSHFNNDSVGKKSNTEEKQRKQQNLRLIEQQKKLFYYFPARNNNIILANYLNKRSSSQTSSNNETPNRSQLKNYKQSIHSSLQQKLSVETFEKQKEKIQKVSTTLKYKAYFSRFVSKTQLASISPSCKFKSSCYFNDKKQPMDKFLPYLRNKLKIS